MDNDPLAKIEETVRQHDFTLYGERGDNGLRGTSKNHEARIQALEKRLILMAALAAGGGAGAVQILAKVFAA